MPQLVYVNGQYVPRHLAAVSIEDRGYQFSDGVYQVMALIQGKIIDEDLHLDALDTSLEALGINPPMARGPLKAIIRRVIHVNHYTQGHIYLQVSRGVQKRAHVYKDDLESSLVVVVTPTPMPDLTRSVPEIKVITTEDNRWARPDIKSLVLLPNILNKKIADEKGAYDVWQVREGVVTEGGASNAWIVNQEGTLQTHPADGKILNGVTRQTILTLAKSNDIKVLEEPFSPEEAKTAQEAFMTAGFSLVKGITQIDDTFIGAGGIGPITKKIASLYGDYVNDYTP